MALLSSLVGLTINTGVILNGLSILLDASNSTSYSGSGTAWNDISGNNRNFTWSSASFTSDGEKSYFSTNGVRATGPASNSVGINNTSGYTVSLVSLVNSISDSSAFKFYGSGSFGRGIFAHLPWSDNTVYFDQGGCCNGDTRTSVASGGATTWNMWTFRRDANSSTRYIIKNTSILATNNTAAADINLTSTGINVGGTDDGNTWNARLGMFLVYNRSLSDSEIARNFEAIRNRYGI